MYVIEGYEFFPEFLGFVLDKGRQLVDAPQLPSRKIEFIGNSITCGYGNEGLKKEEHFDYATENHYYSYASITARNLEAQHWVVARSGIGAYRNYDGPKTGNPESHMPVQYEYTGYAWKPELRKEATFLREKWDFNRYQPDVVCINLGTNDLSTNNYDATLLKQGYQKLLKLVRQHNPKAKIVFLTGSMLYNQELQLAQKLLDEVTAEAQKAGDKEVYRFDMSPIDGNAFYGNDWHPNIYQDEKMASELTAYLRKLMNWF
jgi:lysophospholipase L1-like esterase